ADAGAAVAPAGMVAVDAGPAEPEAPPDEAADDDVSFDDVVDDGSSDDIVTDDIASDDPIDDEETYGEISTLQVVDISAANGDLVLGDRVVVSGGVHNRWQVDESNGVLRVVAQPQRWGDPPVLDTFQVV